MQAERGFFGVDRAHLRQAACAGGGIFRPWVELAGITQIITSTTFIERAKIDGTIDPALDSEVFARFGLTLAMGALVLRTLQVEAPAEGAWHELISRLLDAVSKEQPS